MDRLPIDVIKYILPFDRRFIIRKGQIIQINRIPKNDKRYEILREIPPKEYDHEQNVTYVYLSISENKDYYLTYFHFEIQLQTLVYYPVMVRVIDAYRHLII